MLKNNLKIKFGLGAMLRNPLRIIAAFFTAVIAIGIAGLCIFTDTYDMVAWEKDIFFNYNDDWYMTISVCSKGAWRGYADTAGGLAGNGMRYNDYTTLRSELDDMNCGYAAVGIESGVSYDDPQRVFSIYKLTDYLGGNAELDESENGYTMYYEYNGKQLFAPYVSKTQYKYTETDTDKDFIYDVDLYENFFMEMTIYSGQNAIDEFGYTLVGKLPEGINEVAIPQWLYNSFLCYGYNDPETGEVTVINSEEDIIGKTLKLSKAQYSNEHIAAWNATIVGVVHADIENDPYFTHLSDSGMPSDEYSVSPQIGIIISDKFYEYGHLEFGIYDVPNFDGAITLSRISGRAEEYFNYATSWKQGMAYRNIISPDAWPDRYVVYGVPYSIQSLYVNGSVIEVFGETTIYLKIVPFLVPLAIVLLIYLSVSTAVGRRREIGIIRSLGMNKAKIFLLLIIPLVGMAIAVSLAGLGIECIFLNYMNNRLYAAAQNIIGFYAFTLTLPTWIFTFLAPAATVIISLAITLFILSRRPIRALVAK